MVTRPPRGDEARHAPWPPPKSNPMMMMAQPANENRNTIAASHSWLTAVTRHASAWAPARSNGFLARSGSVCILPGLGSERQLGHGFPTAKAVSRAAFVEESWPVRQVDLPAAARRTRAMP